MVNRTQQGIDGKILSSALEARNTKSPVVVVGLPRSGSSYLSSVMSQINDWYVFDDFYLYRQSSSIGAVDGPLTKKQIDDIVIFLGWQIRARINFPKFNVPNMEIEDVDKIDAALKETLYSQIDSGNDVYWHDAQNEFLYRLANHHGCEHWGYKAPQDFINLPMLKQIYPGLKVVYLYRNPLNVARSFKHLSNSSTDGESAQYHPFVYAKYWKLGHESIEEFAKNYAADLRRVKFEDLVENPEREAKNIADFLGSFLEAPLREEHGNSSFPKRGKRKSVTGLETKIINLVIGRDLLEKEGYQVEAEPVKVSDYFDLAKMTFVFGSHQVRRFITSPRARVSIKNFIKKVVSGG